MTSGTPAARRPLRSDAARNRDHVVRVAREVFARRGLGAGFNDIAREAGVGVGTVYRRFATKDDLVAAALQEPYDAMAATASQALQAEDAWDGLVLFLQRAGDLLAANLGLRQVALGEGGGPVFQAARDRFAPVGDALLARARASGQLRPDVGGADVLVVLCAVTEVARHAGPDRPLLHRRYLQLLLDGMRRQTGRSPLVEPVDDDGVAALAARWTAGG